MDLLRSRGETSAKQFDAGEHQRSRVERSSHSLEKPPSSEGSFEASQEETASVARAISTWRIRLLQGNGGASRVVKGARSSFQRVDTKTLTSAGSPKLVLETAGRAVVRPDGTTVGMEGGAGEGSARHRYCKLYVA
jgi:hypothetical protein